MTYTVDDAKRDAKKGDLSGLIELAELWAHEKKQRRIWFVIAKAMGYEGDGTYDSTEVGEFVAGQIEKSRAKVRARVIARAEKAEAENLRLREALEKIKGGHQPPESITDWRAAYGGLQTIAARAIAEGAAEDAIWRNHDARQALSNPTGVKSSG